MKGKTLLVKFSFKSYLFQSINFNIILKNSEKFISNVLLYSTLIKWLKGNRLELCEWAIKKGNKNVCDLTWSHTTWWILKPKKSTHSSLGFLNPYCTPLLSRVEHGKWLVLQLYHLCWICVASLLQSLHGCFIRQVFVLYARNLNLLR